MNNVKMKLGLLEFNRNLVCRNRWIIWYSFIETLIKKIRKLKELGVLAALLFVYLVCTRFLKSDRGVYVGALIEWLCTVRALVDWPSQLIEITICAILHATAMKDSRRCYENLSWAELGNEQFPCVLTFQQHLLFDFDSITFEISEDFCWVTILIWSVQ